MLEYDFTVPFGDVMVRQILDAVSIDSLGIIDIVDYKSGASAPRDFGWQILQGAHALARHYLFPGGQIRGGSYYDFRQGKLIPYQYHAITDDAIQRRYTWMDRAEKQGLYFPRVGWDCKYCPVRTHCEFGGAG